ncbi:Transcription factor TGAL1 [Glycine soja]
MEDPSQQIVAEQLKAQLPTKPLPPSQAASKLLTSFVIVREARNVNSRGGRGSGRGRGRGGFNRDLFNDENSFAAPAGQVAFEGERPAYGGPPGPYRGSRGGGGRGAFGNGEAAEDGLPRRPFERRNGTGRGNEFKREGAGRGNWGVQTDEFAQATDEVNETSKNFGDEKPSGEDDVAAIGNKENPANEAEEKEPEDKEMTLEEYEKVLEERRKALQALKTEERKVDTKVFESMQQLSNKKDIDDIFIKLGSDKDKRRETLEKEDKSKKSVNINEFLKSPEGESYYNPGGHGRRHGRGRGARGGYGGYATANIPAPSIEDPGQFPTLGVNYTEGSAIDSFCVFDFDQSVGYRIEDCVALRGNSVFDSLKVSSQTISRGPVEVDSFDKLPTSLNKNPLTSQTERQRLQLQKVQLSNLVSGDTEHQEESAMADASPRTDISTDVDTDDKNPRFDRSQSLVAVVSDSSDRSKDKSDQKTLRRLAQNREAARKSRLRKKAYVQQLESSRLKLTQLEQELQRARQQGIIISNSGDQAHSMSGNGAMAFDVEYARWLEEQNRQVNELRAAVNSHAGDTELRMIIDGIMAHYDEIFRLKADAAKADVFHLLSGMWKTPAERCFLWLGGFRSSELLKLLVNQLEPLTEQQLVGITNLQQSSQQAEDALSQGMEALQQSLSETLSTGSLGSSGSSGNVANYMGQMAMAMGKLGTLEGFIKQADNLRQQTLQQIHRILTTRQSARALLAIHDYFSRLRALSSLWLARPRD